jgi:transcriptional regulator with XRE-family HTH domain
MPNILLRSKREERQLTQTEVAEAIGVAVRTVGRWERDEASPTAYCIKKLCLLFEATPEELGLVRSAKQAAVVPMLERSTELAQSAEQLPVPFMSTEGIATTVGEERHTHGNRRLTLYRLRYIVPILLLMLLIVLGARAYFFPTIPISSPQQTLDTFCRTLIDKDFQTAYDQFSPLVQQRVPEGSIMKEYRACTSSPSAITPQHPQCTLLITAGDKRRYWRPIALKLDEHNVWKIDYWGTSHSIR